MRVLGTGIPHAHRIPPQPLGDARGRFREVRRGSEPVAALGRPSTAGVDPDPVTPWLSTEPPPCSAEGVVAPGPAEAASRGLPPGPAGFPARHANPRQAQPLPREVP
ncbi:hypothetical protein [Saccharothrix australiensis]|uniref:Uncharacterized protein n=1 Tax=Saccharothrix australiensis TaxID=2072 RepID=A0A495W4N0_9PSEU|nr:hypothetical protein [Saccharothrix australiensis]RKT55613.1 hypothetical protein C8E97_4294 [Saccharothrix australiensis]